LENQKIEVIGHVHPKDMPNAAIVRVRITSGEDSYDLNYQMIKKNDRWGVINIIFSGVNIVSIFKTQFSSLAAKYQEDLDKVIEGWEISDIRQNS
jgi:ABC-type transporter MlaC component